MKCPFYTRKVGAYDWKGIKCTSQKWSAGLTTGNIRKWSEQERQKHINSYCNGDYTACHQYKNHTN